MCAVDDLYVNSKKVCSCAINGRGAAAWVRLIAYTPALQIMANRAACALALPGSDHPVHDQRIVSNVSPIPLAPQEAESSEGEDGAEGPVLDIFDAAAADAAEAAEATGAPPPIAPPCSGPAIVHALEAAAKAAGAPGAGQQPTAAKAGKPPAKARDPDDMFASDDGDMFGEGSAEALGATAAAPAAALADAFDDAEGHYKFQARRRESCCVCMRGSAVTQACAINGTKAAGSTVGGMLFRYSLRSASDHGACRRRPMSQDFVEVVCVGRAPACSLHGDVCRFA